MSKRKYAEAFSESSGVNTIPSVEASMILQTGNENGNEPIGDLQTVRVNASISSGTRLFQYNRYYWNKDVFCFNYFNSAICLAIAYYNAEDQITSYLYYPIFLPRVALATYQGLVNDGGSGKGLGNFTQDPSKRKYLIDDLLYYLNGAFTSFNFESMPGYPSQLNTVPPFGPYQSGPSLYTSDYKGFLKSMTANNRNFPIFSGNFDVDAPPLQFVYLSSNNQIALIKNDSFFIDEYVNDSIAFQLISPQDYHAKGLTNSQSIIKAPDESNVKTRGNTFNSATLQTDSSCGALFEQKGWCSFGRYALGFGQKRSESNPAFFTDVFGDNYELRKERFSTTKWTSISSPTFPSKGAFEKWAVSQDLELHLVVGSQICSLLPYRFFGVYSDVLTKNQMATPLSNNPVLSEPSLMGIEYMDLDFVRCKVDSTISGYLGSSMANIASTNGYGGSAKPQGFNDTTVVSFIPSFSIQSIDIKIKDEFGVVLQNFKGPNGSYALEYSSYTGSSNIGMAVNLGAVNGNYVFAQNGEFTIVYGPNCPYKIPPWLASLNPNPMSGTNEQPLTSPFSTYLFQSTYWLFQNNRVPQPIVFGPNPGDTILQNVVIPPDFNASLPPAANIIHFGRVLGQ